MDFLRHCISLRDRRYPQLREQVVDLGAANDIVLCGGCSAFGRLCCGWQFCDVCVNSSDCTTIEKRYWHGPSIRKGIDFWSFSNFRNLRIDLRQLLQWPL